MATAESILRIAEVPAAPPGNAPFLIHDTDKAWVVQAGTLDVFLVHLGEDGEPDGARFHAARFGCGDAVLGLNLPAIAPDMGLVACAGPGCRLVEAELRQLRVPAQSPESCASQVECLERWVTVLTSAIAGGFAPKASEAMEAGQTAAIPKSGKAVLAREGVVWIQHLEGSSQFFADADLEPVNGAGLFPLANPAWLQAEPLSKLHGVDTRQFLQLDPEWSGLHRFHAAVLHRLLLKQRRAEAEERRRLEAKQRADELILEASLRKLMAPLEEGPEARPPAAPEADPLLAACQAIGAAAGIEFRWLAGSRPSAHKDPVAEIARASAVRVRQVLLDGDWWGRDAGPLLAIRESDKRPLALLPAGSRRYRLFDPVERTWVGVDKKTSRTLGPYAYSFYRPFPAKKLTAFDLLAFGLRGCERDLWTVLLMGVGAGLLGLLTPILTQTLFDTIIPGAQHKQLLQVFAFLIASAVCTTLLKITSAFATLRLEGRMDAAVQAGIWDRLLSLPVPFFRDFSAGDLAVRSLGINQMRQVLAGSTISSILAGLFSVSSFFLLFYYNWRLALLATGLIAVAFAVSLAAGFRQVHYQRDTTEYRGRISGMVLQFVNGISKFRVAGTEDRAFATWAGQFARQTSLSLKARTATNRLRVFNAVFPVFSSGCIFFYVAKLLAQPGTAAFSTGDFLAFQAAFGQFLAAALQLSSSLVGALSVVPLYERAKPILDALPEVDGAKSHPGELAGHIEVSHVAFRYRADTPPVLRDVSIRVNAGEFVAFVGASGCGKSTLFRLLLGFETLESGAIFYDGQDLANVDISALRRQIGVVLQNAKLLSGSIFQNIVGSAPLTIDDAWEAARMAGFEQDVKQMPMGMHTLVSEGGGGLSGGQRQRLMIARAIVGKPRILLFDEATSALDNQTQAIVSRSLEQLKATRIVIAHRLSTVMNADRIFVLDKGAVVESGAYRELMERGGFFAELARRQLT
jgi:NHLM bacteriocin system ABC transporter ATP-binding protein